MNNITDYVKEYGKKTLEELPFNEVDSLVLCQFSYLKFDGMIPVSANEDVFVTVEKLAQNKHIENAFLDARYEKVNRGLFYAMKESVRFGQMKIRDYVNIVSEEIEEQFSALTCVFDNGFSYVAFRGTDDSIIGWKEDFNMGFMSVVPAQEHARVYLNRSGRKCPEGFCVGGHSKGGNLAVYSAMKCNESVKSKIKYVFSHDGPGFSEGILDSGDFKSITDRIRKTVPRSSIIGMLLQTQEKYETVSCRSVGVLQHDPFNWHVVGHCFKRADDIHETIKIRNNALNQWISSLTKDEVKKFTNTLFKVVSQADLYNLNDFVNDPVGMTKSLGLAFDELNDSEKKMMFELFSSLVNFMNENFKNYMVETMNEKFSFSSPSNSKFSGLESIKAAKNKMDTLTQANEGLKQVLHIPKSDK